MNQTLSSESPEQIQYNGFVSVFLFFIGAVFSLIYWLVFGFFLYVFGLLTCPLMKPDAHRNLGHCSLGRLFRYFFNILESIGIVKINDSDLSAAAEMKGPLVIASNHPSLWDAPLLIRRFVSVSCIMKAEITNNPILYGGSRFAGFIPNYPKLDMIRKATAYLKQGGRLLLFPEGTRTRDASRFVNPFRPGLALLSKTADCPILPVYLHMNSAYLEKGWPAWKMPPMPIVVTVQVGEIVSPTKDENTHEYSARLEQHFCEEIRTRFPR